MKFHFLGTSAGSPTIERNVTSLALTFEQRSTWYMFDCGDGTQQRVLRTSLSLPRLDKIFITHMHGDHCYGLPGILTSRGLMSGAESPITIFGPKGIEKFVETILKLSFTKLRYPLYIYEFTEGGILFEDDAEEISCVGLSHDVPSFAYVLREKDRPGTFDAQAAKAEGVPPGPLFGKLSRGEIITLEDGRVIDGQQFIGPSRAGRKVIIGGDNDSAELLRHAAEGASVMIHESTHTETVKESLSWSARHSTASSVAKVAESAGVKNLILTHFSPRFSLKVPDGDDSSMTQLRDEAKKFYTGNLNLAQDFDIYSLDRENCLERTSARNRKTKPVS